MDKEYDTLSFNEKGEPLVNGEPGKISSSTTSYRAVFLDNDRAAKWISVSTEDDGSIQIAGTFFDKPDAFFSWPFILDLQGYRNLEKLGKRVFLESTEIVISPQVIESSKDLTLLAGSQHWYDLKLSKESNVVLVSGNPFITIQGPGGFGMLVGLNSQDGESIEETQARLQSDYARVFEALRHTVAAREETREWGQNMAKTVEGLLKGHDSPEAIRQAIDTAIKNGSLSANDAGMTLRSAAILGHKVIVDALKDDPAITVEHKIEALLAAMSNGHPDMNYPLIKALMPNGESDKIKYNVKKHPSLIQFDMDYNGTLDAGEAIAALVLNGERLDVLDTDGKKEWTAQEIYSGLDKFAKPSLVGIKRS